MAQPVRTFFSSELAALPSQQADVLKIIAFLQLQHGDPSGAIVLFDALRVLFPSEHRITLSLAFAFLRAGDPQGALDVLDDASPSLSVDQPHLHDIRQESLEPCHHLLRGQALAGLGRMAEAARSMRLFTRQRRLLEKQEPI